MLNDLYRFMSLFIEFFFYPLKSIDIGNILYSLVYVVVIGSVVFAFVKGVSNAFNP